MGVTSKTSHSVLHLSTGPNMHVYRATWARPLLDFLNNFKKVINFISTSIVFLFFDELGRHLHAHHVGRRSSLLVFELVIVCSVMYIYYAIVQPLSVIPVGNHFQFSFDLFPSHTCSPWYTHFHKWLPEMNRNNVHPTSTFTPIRSADRSFRDCVVREMQTVEDILGKLV